MDWTNHVILPAIGLLLLGVNFFFVLAEFALVRLRASRVTELIEAGDPRALVVQRIQSDMDSFLSVVQVGITGATLGIGKLIEPMIAEPIVALVGDGVPGLAVASHVLGFLLATFVVIVTSELLPKSLAIRYAEPCALICARPMLWAYWSFFPLLWVMTKSSQGIMRLFRLTRGTEEAPHSEDELRIILDQSQEHGLMSFRRLLFIENVFDLGELKVKDAMRHRSQVRCLVRDLAWADTLQFIRTWRFSRYPLILDDADRPSGFVHLKDLLLTDGPPDLVRIMRPYLTTTEQTPLEQLLGEMQRKRNQFALVTNADGRWTGIISLEDILEEIVGTIGDEFEREEQPMLADAVSPERVVLGAQGANLAEALRLALARIPADHLPGERDAILKAVMERERIAGTYLTRGVALPHARLPGLSKAALILIRHDAGIPVEGSKDRAHLLFVLLTPAGQPRVHQRLQAHIAAMLENSDFIDQRLRDATTGSEAVEIIRTGEQAAID
jgi:CBS domain containing-hemolysin-like protein